MPINDQSAAITYNPLVTYPAGTIGAALQAGAVGAPINSPNFTGDPRAPTPTPGDNDTSIATTAFVTNAVTAVSVPNGDKGDITVSGTGNVWTIDPQAVTLAKMVNATAQYRLWMRTSAGAGSMEEVQGSADVANFLTSTNFGNMRSKLSLGALSTQSLVDNADWDAAGLALAVTNGGTGAKTTPLARTALSGSWTTLVDGATIATDCAVNDRFTVTLAGTPRTLANPSNIIDGCDYRWRIVQDATGGRPLTLGSAFNFAAGAPAFAVGATPNSVSYLSGIGRGAKIDVVATVGFPWLMFVAPFFFQETAGTLATPALATLTPWLYTSTTNWGEPPANLSQAFTSTSGNVGFIGATLGQTSTARDLVLDWNGGVMTELARGALGTSGRLIAEVGVKTGGTVGVGNAGVTLTAGSGTNSNRFLNAWLFDLDQVRGGIGGSVGVSINVTQAFVEATINVLAAGSLLVAGGWCRNPPSAPYSWSAGWTQIGSQTVGSGGGNPTGTIASRSSPAPGPLTVRVDADVPTNTSTDWAMVVVEFLPG